MQLADDVLHARSEILVRRPRVVNSTAAAAWPSSAGGEHQGAPRARATARPAVARRVQRTASTMAEVAAPWKPGGLDNALGQHGIGHFHEPADVRALHVVRDGTARAVPHAVGMDGMHDLLQIGDPLLRASSGSCRRSAPFPGQTWPRRRRWRPCRDRTGCWPAETRRRPPGPSACWRLRPPACSRS